MARNAEKYIDAITHAIGRTPDSRISAWAILNDAGRDCFALHDWWFRHRDATLNLTADQDYIELPETWGGLEAASMAEGGAFTRLEEASLGDIMARRNAGGSGAASGTLYAYFAGAEGQAFAEDVPHGRALIYPTPAATEARAINVVFRALWREIDEDDTTAVPNIPVSHEKLLLSLCRAHAIGLEDQSDAHEDADVKRQLEILIREDGRRQRSYGRMRGGAGRFAGGRFGFDQHDFGSVTV